MTFDEFKEKYQHVVAAPLAYDAPEVDLQKLLSWAAANRDNEYNLAVYHGYPGTKEEFYGARKSDMEFFESFYLLSGKQGEKSTWYNDFDKEFPEIAEFVQSMPILGEPMFGFILQKSEDEITGMNPHQICRIHTDERSSFGLRLYLNSSKNRMMFYGVKEGQDIETLIQNGANTPSAFHEQDSEGNLIFDEDDVPLATKEFYSKPRPTKFKTSNTVFIFNNINAAHYVHHEHDPKVTFLIMGRRGVQTRYDWAKIDESLQQAMLTRGDEFLYYDDLRD